jgi:hypothetical protein
MKDSLLEAEHCIVVPGGGSMFFEAHSNEYLHEMSDAVPLIALFGSERMCRLSFPRFDRDATVQSQEIKFTDFSTDAIFRGD